MVAKAGVKTTEFAVTVLTELGFLLAAVQGSLSPKWAAAAAAAAQAAYALSRAITKHGATVPVVVPAAPAPVPTPPVGP